MNRKLSKLERRFHRIARQLTRFDLQKLGSSEEKSVSLDEVVGDLQTHSGTSLFMGLYSHSGLMEVLDKYGITKLLRHKGFSDLHLQVHTNDPFRHILQLYWGTGRDPEKLLVEIVLHEGAVTPKSNRFREMYDMVFIEWLCLQNPLAEFTRAKPRLPGQQKPGLGISMEIAELLAIMTERLRKDGLVNIPRYYHTAHMARVGFMFMDPKTEGVMRALERDLHEHSLAQASWAMELGLVTQAGEPGPFLWAGEEQVSPTSKKMKEYFDSEGYKLRCLEAERSARFVVDWKTYARRCLGMSGRVTQA